MYYTSALQQDTGGLYDAMLENGANAIDTRTGLNYTLLCLCLYRYRLPESSQRCIPWYSIYPVRLRSNRIEL